ncbi:hypothetical protein BaOVIS_031090 [Babesia ovis]|uniref:Secreted protein n=1 Tax=Babesia ovis TaxID=5869 RepID=A0A9W5TD23_BABOV|nr:hypothetical protein BaOVIS_031090 [Babesia ovis]
MSLLIIFDVLCLCSAYIDDTTKTDKTATAKPLNEAEEAVGAAVADSPAAGVEVEPDVSVPAAAIGAVDAAPSSEGAGAVDSLDVGSSALGWVGLTATGVLVSAVEAPEEDDGTLTGEPAGRVAGSEVGRDGWESALDLVVSATGSPGCTAVVPEEFASC